MRVLGIETSCDETAVAVVGSDRKILSNLVLSQIGEHEAFGGVVPEIAARAHLDHLDRLIATALKDAGVTFADLGGVAATAGPGLIGGVMVGLMAGKAIAAAREIPLVAVNHLEAHVLTPRLSDNVDFPYLTLLVSGGHTQILLAEDVGRYHIWGETIDDALGECFDKSAKLMGLPFPGGPHLEKRARLCTNLSGAQDRFPLPRPMTGRNDCDFSFSGLKTAMRAHIDRLPPGALTEADAAALALSFEIAVTDTVTDRLRNALKKFKTTYPEGRTLAVCGGVAANQRLRQALQNLAADFGISFVAPPLPLCSDNGAMIAWAGIERLQRNLTDTLAARARPRWPLDEERATT